MPAFRSFEAGSIHPAAVQERHMAEGGSGAKLKVSEGGPKGSASKPSDLWRRLRVSPAARV